MCNILNWFKSDCVDYTKPDKQIIVEPSKERDLFESMPEPTWAHPPVYKNQWDYYYNLSANNFIIGSRCANLTIL